jgi:predicted permease
MMLIGAALSRVQKFVFAPRFVSLSFAAKFVMWPAMVTGLILLDTHALHIYSAEIHKLFFVLAIVPIAANISAFAVEMDLKPEKAASTILLSTFFALFSIPFSLYLYEQFIAIAP